MSVSEIALEITLGFEQSDRFGFGDEHVSNALPADRVAGAINLRNLRDGFVIFSGQFKLRIDVGEPEVGRAGLREGIELLPAHLFKRDNRFGGGDACPRAILSRDRNCLLDGKGLIGKSIRCDVNEARRNCVCTDLEVIPRGFLHDPLLCGLPFLPRFFDRRVVRQHRAGDVT